LPNLTNPFRGIAIKGSQPRRERRLKEGELQRLEKACKSCHELNRLYLPLGIYLAVETGMRLQEVLNLTWRDLDLEQRRIDIRKSKTDNITGRKGRKIVMTVMASIVLERLQCTLEMKGIGLSESVFPMTKDAYKQAFAKVVRRAEISDLHFHDLRHEAASRFHEAELTAPEQDQMMGHTGRSMASRYIHVDLNRIQDKLDKHVLAGRTLKEAEASWKMIVHNDGGLTRANA